MNAFSLNDFVSFDLPAILTALFTALTCAILGSILVVRKQSLMGDAISHSVLPGIVVAFLITGSRDSSIVFVGAALAGILAAICIGIVKKLSRLDEGAAMGVVFSLFFASGVVLIELAAARNIDLDADCLLHGQLEHIFWLPSENWISTLNLSELPFELLMSVVVFIVCALSVVLLFKEWKILSFDPALASSLGMPVVRLELFFLVLLAAAVVSSFYVVGTILVIALLICPGASARMFTDSLRMHIWLSALFAVVCVLIGYATAAWLPLQLGFESSISAAGMICVMAGMLLATSVVMAPNYGLLSKIFRKFSYAVDVEAEDILALMYREARENREVDLSPQSLVHRIVKLCAVRRLQNDNLINEASDGLALTKGGELKGQQLVRQHRQWEHYLVEEVGLRADHVHDRAMELEHVKAEVVTEELEKVTEEVSADPHGKEIPNSEDKI